MGKPAAAKVEEPKKEVATQPASSIPAYAKDVKSESTSNMRTQDLIVPRIVLLQGLSPQVQANPREVFAGSFWHNVNDEYVGEAVGDAPGKTFEFIAFKSRFYYILFAPRGDARTVLARADDGVHWTPASGEFKVKPKKSPSEVTWKLAPTVSGSRLDQFGTSIPADPNSQPAATLIYEYLSFLPKYPDIGPVIISLARSQVKRGKLINTTHAMGAAPMTAYKFLAGVSEEKGAEGPYYNWSFKRAGWATEDEFKQAETWAAEFKNQSFKAAGEEEYAGEGDGGPSDEPKDVNNKKGF